MNTLSLSKKKSLTVLIADDDAELREILHAEFELEGLTVITATTGSEAVTSVRRLKPDIVLMETMMSEMNGIEATKIIKNDKETEHIPVILLTTAGNRDEIVEGIEAGAIDYIAKPFFVPELKARLRAVLQYQYFG